MKHKEISKFSLFGLIILILCYLISVWNVIIVNKSNIKNKKTLTIAHWQLELGVKEGLNKLITEYAKLHPNIIIEQIRIPQKRYGQWRLIQLVGENPPDMMQTHSYNLTLLPHFYIPITKHLKDPNPYNENDHDIANTPWRDTFKDGLENAYISEYLDYFTVGLSQFNYRCVLNKSLYQRILNKKTPPKDFDELINNCKMINLYVENENKKIRKYNSLHNTNRTLIVIDPIGASRHQVERLDGRISTIFTADKRKELDFNYDGQLSPFEMMKALLTGDFTLYDSKYKASREMFKELTQYFTTGFMSNDRMNTNFRFVQGRSVITMIGSYDINSFLQQIKEQPFGDIILKIEGQYVENAEEAKKKLLQLALNKQSVEIEIKRNNNIKRITIKPKRGKNILSIYGFNIDDINNNNKTTVPIISFVKMYSPAYDAGFQERKRFETIFFEFPFPNKNNEKYGQLIAGNALEFNNTAFSFGISKTSKNKEIAIDFLKFCTARKNNEKFNKSIKWLPVIKRSKTADVLKIFKPNYNGFVGNLNSVFGRKESLTKQNQLFWSYISGDLTYNEYANKFTNQLAKSLPLNLLKEKQENTKLYKAYMQKNYYLSRVIFANNNNYDNQKKLSGAWDAIYQASTKNPRIKALLQPLLDKTPKNKFAELFVKKYNAIKPKN